MKKRLLLIGLVLLVAGGAVAYFMWNKPHQTVDDQVGTAVSAEVLTQAFEQNEQQANLTYLNKILEVSGTISEVSKNQDGKTVLILQSENPLSGVQCTLKDEAALGMGQAVVVKGFCNGYTTVVLLADCIVKK